MAQYYKFKEDNINDKVLDYFYLNTFNNYEKIILTKDHNYPKLIELLSLDNVLEVSKKGLASDNNPIYLNLNRLTLAKIIYLKEEQLFLEEAAIKTFFQGFKGIIISNEKLIPYLRSLGILHDDYYLNDKTYIIIDCYGKAMEVSI